VSNLIGRRDFNSVIVTHIKAACFSCVRKPRISHYYHHLLAQDDERSGPRRFETSVAQVSHVMRIMKSWSLSSCFHAKLLSAFLHCTTACKLIDRFVDVTYAPWILVHMCKNRWCFFLPFLHRCVSRFCPRSTVRICISGVLLMGALNLRVTKLF